MKRLTNYLKNKKSIVIFSFLFASFTIILFSTCKKEKETPEKLVTPPAQNPSIDTVTDIDGNTYHTVTIGTQCWFKENLNTSRYRNGDPIPTGLSDYSWRVTASGAYASPDTVGGIGNVALEAVYGKLYNFYTVIDPRELCPSGWHVPSDTEWATLENFLGGNSVAGGKLKETGTTHWFSPNTNATNSSGFTGLPGGYRNYSGAFYTIGSNGFWWSSTENDSANAWDRYLNNNNGFIIRGNYNKQNGFSVRCLRD